MDKVLIQKRGFRYRKFEITDDRLVLEIKTFTKTIHKYIELSEIGYEKKYERTNGWKAILISLCFFLLPFTLLIPYFRGEDIPIIFAITFTSISWILAISTYQPTIKDITLYGGYHDLVFHQDIPDEQAVEQFITTLIEVSQAYIRKKYLSFEDYEDDAEKIQALNWLLKRGAISKNEYDFIRSELKHKALF